MAGKRDREKLRVRVRGLLEVEGRSQKDLEGALGLPSGTLTRLYSGKKNLDPELLAKLAEGLDAEPASLVEGTAWEALVGTSPPPPEPVLAEEPAESTEPTEESPTPTEESVPPSPEPAPAPPRVEPPPPRKRTRKRDLPVMALRFLSDLIFG